jgi:CheY-like chemotaxis protein
MVSQPKILLLDDDQDFLDLYREMLSQHLSCLPDVRTASSASRAMALLDSEPFALFIIDLHMPKMDGLQVLAIVRRKYPQMRLVVLTAIRDEQFRTRAYAMGVDQYWIKPETDHEMGLFMESIESLLARDTQSGFRGVQSKSLVDIIQLECLSQTSCVLKINNGAVEGKIWVQNGEVIHAEAPGVTAEPAFQRILTWKTGSFELAAADLNQPRTIFTSYQGLLLNTAQALDEAASLGLSADTDLHSMAGQTTDSASFLAELSQMDGVEFVLATGADHKTQYSWGVADSEQTSTWMRETISNFESLGEHLKAGEMRQVIGAGPQRKVALVPCKKSELCIGFPPTLPLDRLRETLHTILAQWAS